MVAERETSSPYVQRVLALLRLVIAADEDTDMAALAHRVPIAAPGWDVPITFTVYLAPDEAGTFLASCRELPEVLTFGETEEEALAMAELAILDELAARQAAADPGR